MHRPANPHPAPAPAPALAPAPAHAPARASAPASAPTRRPADRRPRAQPKTGPRIEAVKPTAPARAAAPAAKPDAESDSRVPTAQPARIHSRNDARIDASREAAPPVALSPEPPPPVDFDGIASTAMFETLGSIRALAPITKPDAPAYSRDEVYAVAEIAYHYLRCGGYKLAAVLFEGLAAVAPDEAYFALALGLCADMLGDAEAAGRWYQHARRIDPTDARADVNLAEMMLAARDKKTAIALLQSGAKKARNTGDAALARRASAILDLIGAKS